MRVFDCIQLSGKQLWRRKLRAGLCAAAVGIGIFAMLLIASLGLFGKQQMHQVVTHLGISGLTIYVSQKGNGQTLTAAHAQAIQSCFASVSCAMSVKAESAAYHAAQQSGQVIALGADENLEQVMQLEVWKGQLFSAEQVKSGERVAVIDTDFAKKVYGRINVVGKEIQLRIQGLEMPYRIIGVIAPQTAALGALVQNLAPTLVYVPYPCIADTADPTDQIFVQCREQADADKIGEQLLEFLTSREGVQGTLAVQNLSGTLQQAERFVSDITWIFIAVAAVSFLVAMLGVVSGLVSATHEKTAEIGMYMAIGACKKDILQLFLCQSVLICFIGGLSGGAAAGLSLRLLQWFTKIALPFPWMFLMESLIGTAICGILAGLLPALWAAKLHPVDAMRRG